MLPVFPAYILKLVLSRPCYTHPFSQWHQSSSFRAFAKSSTKGAAKSPPIRHTLVQRGNDGKPAPNLRLVPIELGNPHAARGNPAAKGFPVPMSSFNMRSRQVQQNSQKILQTDAFLCLLQFKARPWWQVHVIFGELVRLLEFLDVFKNPLLIKQGIDKVLGKVCLKKQTKHIKLNIKLNMFHFFFLRKKVDPSTLFLFKLSFSGARHKLHGHEPGPQFLFWMVFFASSWRVSFQGSQRHVSGHQNGWVDLDWRPMQDDANMGSQKITPNKKTPKSAFLIFTYYKNDSSWFYIFRVSTSTV